MYNFLYLYQQRQKQTQKLKIMKLTKEQLEQLSKIRKELIETYNNNEKVNYTTVRDIDNLIEEIIKK